MSTGRHAQRANDAAVISCCTTRPAFGVSGRRFALYAPRVTPGELLRRGPFRRLWVGDAVSMFGDWFTYVAVGTLALSAGSGLLAVATVLVAHSLPRALLAPLAGRLADTLDRRRILVVVSLLRALVVVGMILAASAGAIVVLQALLFVRMALGAFIDPAASAALPQLVRRERLGTANALLGATYSTIFALGVAIGGLATAWIGPIGALVIDAVSFVIAAVILGGLPRLRPGDRHVDADTPVHADISADRGTLADAWRLAWRERQVLQASLIKLPLGLANGGAWILLHALAGGLADTALALGAFHCARALGTGLGPLLWARIPAWSGTAAGLHAGAAATFLGIGVFTIVSSPPALLLASALWGLGMGASWVTAATRIQTLTPNPMLGRIAAIDLMGHTLGQCLGGLAGALVAEAVQTAGAAGWLGLAAGLAVWLVLQALVGRRRGPAISISLLLACGAPTTSVPALDPPAPAVVAQPPAPAPAPAPASPISRLAARAVHHNDFARRQFYTWTTAEQAATLRTSRHLLVADATTGGLATPYSASLAALARRGDPGHEVATLLLERPDLRRHRYAWTSPFATTLGLGPRRYGDVLIGIELGPDAWIGRFTPAAREPFVFVDMQGRPVALAAVLADPGRIGAIYHVRDGPKDEVAFREYVVCNAAQITRWELATAELHALINEEIELLDALRRNVFAMLPEPALRASAAPAWASARATPTPLDLWHAALAFDSLHYRPSPGNLERNAAALRQYDHRGDPLVESRRPAQGQQLPQASR